ncbi:hypothetical protein RB653_007446 [Dictyostelium firmibasis]|uniref:dolichyl-P-Man:Man5GlcNAc2-PP-dolichol alpha-1,3-mannosyltransferase n=1 Tax=Dictyostelium firmibasis TaxID=79012 RepID=A0AAN7YXL1_9MYCE
MIENKVIPFIKNNQIKCFYTLASFLIIYELCINKIIIDYVKYTEIDWSTYVQQVEVFLKGIYDYTKIEGDTGPCVYPAGHLYVFSLLYNWTENGLNILKAQYIFAAIYILLTIIVFLIYGESIKESDKQQSKTITKNNNNNNNNNIFLKIPFYIIIFLCLSKRIHSIFALRMFNDCISMFLFYISLYLIIKGRWNLGCLFFSCSVSVKMNVLLYAPALLFLMLSTFGFWRTIPKLMICGFVQVLLAIPFLLVNPQGYLLRAFEFSRQFLFKWTVNWRFLPEDLFLNKFWALFLLSIHLFFIFLFYLKYIKKEGGILNILKRGSNNENSKLLSVNYILLTMFTINLIGVTFSRSLHYQFYLWYFHTLPFLLWSTNYNLFLKIGFMLITEYAWNTYPSTSISSLMLFISNFILLIQLYLQPTINSLRENNNNNSSNLKKQKNK